MNRMDLFEYYQHCAGVHDDIADGVHPSAPKIFRVPVPVYDVDVDVEVVVAQ